MMPAEFPAKLQAEPVILPHGASHLLDATDAAATAVFDTLEGIDMTDAYSVACEALRAAFPHLRLAVGYEVHSS